MQRVPSLGCLGHRSTYIGKDSKRIQQYEEEVINAEIGRKVHDLRAKAGLSRRELAKRVGASHLPHGRCRLRRPLSLHAQAHCPGTRPTSSTGMKSETAKG